MRVSGVPVKILGADTKRTPYLYLVEIDGADGFVCHDGRSAVEQEASGPFPLGECNVTMRQDKDGPPICRIEVE